MKNNKWIIIVIFILLSIVSAFALTKKPQTSNQTASQPLTTSKEAERTYLLEGYPLDKVPLYKLNKVSSNKIFKNTNPNNTSEFDVSNFAYFNVVFYSDASQEEFLNYYKNLFDSQITDEFEKPDMVKGNIGEYKVSAAHYGSDKTGYIQVHLPNYQDPSLDKYFIDFPKILELDSKLVEHEISYGLLNQKGGEVEFTKYYTVIDSGDQNNDGKDDIDEFLVLEEEYKTKFGQMPEYSYDEKSGAMKWKDGDYQISMSISRDHGRIYLMIRKKI